MTYLQLDSRFVGNVPVSTDVLASAENDLHLSLPSDYVSFLRIHNGGEGFIGRNYIIMWRVEKIAEYNREYQVSTYATGLLVFGSSGGGEAYAFDVRNQPFKVVRIPFIGMSLETAIDVATTFAAFIQKLCQGPLD